MSGGLTMPRRYVIAIGVAVIVAGFAYWCASTPRTGTRVQLPSSALATIDISVSGRPLTTITNAEGLAEVMAMLRTGRSVRQHESKSRGAMELRFTDGQTLKISFLPGHHFFALRVCDARRLVRRVTLALHGRIESSRGRCSEDSDLMGGLTKKGWN
jgi:hypothetical protein